MEAWMVAVLVALAVGPILVTWWNARSKMSDRQPCQDVPSEGCPHPNECGGFEECLRPSRAEREMIARCRSKCDAVSLDAEQGLVMENCVFRSVTKKDKLSSYIFTNSRVMGTLPDGGEAAKRN